MFWRKSEEPQRETRNPQDPVFQRTAQLEHENATLRIHIALLESKLNELLEDHPSMA